MLESRADLSHLWTAIVDETHQFQPRFCDGDRCYDLSGAAQAQVRTDVERAPTLTNERYSEDWSYLSDPSKRTGHWTEPFKFIRLDENGAAYLSTGMEVRSRYEGYTNVGWGSAPNDRYVWNRFMPYADLHAGQMRFFAQPIVSGIVGTDRALTLVDTTGADMLQAFGEIEMQLGDRITLRTSAGRKMVSLGAGRFVDTRYGPNIPRAFDGVDAIVTAPDRQVTLLYARPVDNFPGDFDDRTSHQQSLWGAYATQWLKENRSVGFDIYYLGLLDRKAVFDQGSGRELVHTFGTRIFGDTGAWFWNFEGAVQRGTFGNGRVAAWGVGGEFGYRFLETPLQPEVRITTDVISETKTRTTTNSGRSTRFSREENTSARFPRSGRETSSRYDQRSLSIRKRTLRSRLPAVPIGGKARPTGSTGSRETSCEAAKAATRASSEIF